MLLWLFDFIKKIMVALWRKLSAGAGKTVETAAGKGAGILSGVPKAISDGAIRMLDRDGDGKLTVEDVNRLYADVFDDDVKQSGKLLPYLVRQPLGWLGTTGIVVSAVVSYLYYSTSYQGHTGQLFGVFMAVVSAMSLFAVAYYADLYWRKDAGKKIMALLMIFIISLSNIISYSGLMYGSRDRASVRNSAVAIVGQNDIKSLDWTIKRKAKIRQLAGGIPRDPALVKADLSEEKARHFCRSKKSWCLISNYCAERKGHKRCRTLKGLQEEYRLAAEWKKLNANVAQYKDTALSGDVVTQADVHAHMVSLISFMPDGFVRKYVDIWQGTAIEILTLLIFYFVTLRARANSDRVVEAQLAMKDARRSELMDGVADVNTQALNQASLMMETKAKPKQEEPKKEEQEKKPEVFQVQQVMETPSEPEKQAEPEGPQKPKEPEAKPVKTVVDDNSWKEAQLWDFRESALRESTGSWLPVADIYQHYTDWVIVRDQPLMVEADFHELIGEKRMIVTTPRDGAPGYAGMVPKDIVEQGSDHETVAA